MILDNDAAVIDGLRRALSRGMGREIELVQRRTYQEITGLLLERSVDAAWLCGYPYLQHADLLDLVAVPVGAVARDTSLTSLSGLKMERKRCPTCKGARMPFPTRIRTRVTL